MLYQSSTQRKHWLFDEYTLSECRERALRQPQPQQLLQGASSTGEYTLVQVQKFASGFHQRQRVQHKQIEAYLGKDVEAKSMLRISVDEQETLLRFHCHQLQHLIGPAAIVESVRTSERVLSTAISLLRRFYLSNCVVDIGPRQIAVASAFFAAKLEEERVEVSDLFRS